MISWQRMIYILSLAVVEATPVALLLLVVATSGAWGLMILAVLAGALADWLAAAWLPIKRQQPALLGIALLLALWMIKGQVGGGYGLLSGWDMALGALFSLRNPQSWTAYLLLLIVLYAFRRGTRLLDHDSLSIRKFFARGAVALLLILGISFIGMVRPDEARITLTTVMLLTYFAVGLLAIALATAAEEYDTQLTRLGWRGVLTLLGAIGLVLILGLLFASLFGQDAAQSVVVIARALLLIILLICLPIVLLLESFLEWIFRLTNLESLLRALEQRQQAQQLQQLQAGELLDIFPPWLKVALEVFLALLPVLIIVGLYLLVRRRARRATSRDEERESLWSWSGLASDVRDLFAGLRRPGHDEGLRGALVRLRGDDPVSRIRRSYIRLLLAGEAHAQPRTAPQTPREYAPAAGAMLPAAAQPIATLTDAYERARYHPSATSDADADTAERAWGEIDAADRRPGNG
ncbi:MAG TPA: DUF4129 domain-containing protein [Roseiflexaceae bacterium]